MVNSLLPTLRVKRLCMSHKEFNPRLAKNHLAGLSLVHREVVLNDLLMTLPSQSIWAFYIATVTCLSYFVGCNIMCIMKILRKRRWEELKTLWLLVYLHQGHRAWFLAYKCINGCFRIYLIYLCCTCFNLCLFPCIFVPIDSVTRALQFARMMSLHAAPKAEWACLLTKLSRGAHQRFACWGNMEITSHDLSLHHPNFAFVNCERQTKYEEIIGDYVKPAMQEQDLITINLHPCDNAYVKVHSIPIWLDSWVLCKISCFRKTASGQRQSDRERGKGKSGDLTAMDYVASKFVIFVIVIC
ncbi:hypothetical protein ACFXTI_028072 [Malus domestica]